jgi:glycosyltransferase involved in cell wall biosynthesis
MQPDSSGALRYCLESDFSQPLVVGRGTIVPVAGWCYHPAQRIRALHIQVGANLIPVRAHSMARPDVHREQAAYDPKGHSLTSGFLALVPLGPIATDGCLPLALRATLANGRTCSQPLGTLSLAERRSDSPSPAMHPAYIPPPIHEADRTPLVGICMATYDPPPELFERQIESIRRQTHEHWICIISDDCSPPEAFARILHTVGSDQRFRVVRNHERLGFYHNFERCLAQVPAAAEFVALADQDDEWYPDKLHTTLSAFQPDTLLVYTDMDIVTEEGEVLSHTYWVGRKNNSSSLMALLFVNTVTGGASMFRASLLADVLPFPVRVGPLFHDHWIACVALTQGALGYVSRPTYAYRQHAGNVVGYNISSAWRFLPRPSHLIRALTRPSVLRRRLGLLMWDQRHVFFNDVMRIVVIARTLDLRFPAAPVRKRLVLRHFARFEYSLFSLFIAGVACRIARRPTVGAQWHCLRGAVAQRLCNVAARLSHASTHWMSDAWRSTHVEYRG